MKRLYEHLIAEHLRQERQMLFLVARDGSPWLLVEAKLSERAHLSPLLGYFQSQTGADLALQVVLDLPFVDRDCFELTRPMIVPARTFLSQLV